MQHNVTVVRSRNHCYRAKAISITYCVCVCLSVNIIIRHAKRMCRLHCHSWPV